MAEDITNGELARRIDAVLAELRRIGDRYVSREAHEALKERVGSLEERSTFVSRVAWTGAILPIIVALALYLTIKGGP